MDASATTTAPSSGSTPGILINNQPSASSQPGTSASASNMARLRRESIAHSQGMGGVSWGSLTIGSWLRDEVMIHAHMSAAHSNSGPGPAAASQNAGSANVVNLSNANSFSPPGAASAYLPNLEKQYCKDYSCCGLLLPGLHDLLRHYEEAHISTSPGTTNTHASSMANIPTTAASAHNVTGAPGGVGANFVGMSSSAQTANNNLLKKQRMAAMYQQQLQHQAHDPTQTQQQQLPQNHHQQQQQQQRLHNSQQSPHQQPQQHQQQRGQLQQHIQQGIPHQTNPHTQAHIQHSFSQEQRHNLQFQQSPPQQQQQQQQQRQQHQTQLQQQLQNQMLNQAMQQQLHGVSHNPSSNTTSNVQQLHLNGNLVDAVSTNEVFLQTGAAQSGKAGNMMNPSLGNGRFSNNKMQAAFNNYSLNMQPMSKHGMDASTLQQQQFQHQQQQQFHQQPQQQHAHQYQQQQLRQQQRPGSQVQQQQQHRPVTGMSNSSLQRSRVPSQVNTAAAGIDLDFMDADIIDDLHDGSAIMGAAPSLTAEVAKAWKQVDVDPASKMPTHRTKLGGAQDSDDSSMSEDDEEDEVTTAAVPATAANKRKQQAGFIDDPARRLYVMDHEEHKPFKCPVIGCDKTYKNQNGLKYHKLHGHQNQKLHENPDGTFSIIDPESNEPYPDGMGFEKDKPYRCEVCGKRYKNLNGLKYHRGHSTH
ncbi:Split finger protein [Lachancea thermotolerans]